MRDIIEALCDLDHIDVIIGATTMLAMAAIVLLFVGIGL
jgi:hypothetical protein